MPYSLGADSIGLNASVEPYTDEMVRHSDGGVNPRDPYTVAWWSGGSPPSARATSTAYLYGHTWYRPAVFNRIKELQRGDRVWLTTSEGVLWYEVERTYVVPKSELPDDPRVTKAVAGRLLLIGCYRESGWERRTTENVVVQAQLLP
ncbi:MAG: class F sortase [Actinomycetota bacterium]|nr:class F sortase [Actinomycetota bacterium]